MNAKSMVCQNENKELHSIIEGLIEQLQKQETKSRHPIHS